MEVADLADMVTQKQRFAIVGTRAPADTNHLTDHCLCIDRIFLGGQGRGACRLSPGLHRTSQRLVQATWQIHTYYIGLLW